MPTSIISHVADELRQRMAAMSAGERLPPVRQLMTAYGVSQMTVQRALTQLKTEGLLTTNVGRGTFVGSARPTSEEQRSVLVLTREQQTERSDEVARSLHRALLKRDWRTAVLAYSDFAQATDLIRSSPRFDACVVHPRHETLPLELLATARLRSRAVVVEGFSVEGVDVDGVAIDWNAALGLGLRHLIDLDHRRIGLVALDRPARAFASVISQFRLLKGWADLQSTIDPVVLLPDSWRRTDYTELFGRLRALADDRGRTAFSAVIMFVGTYHGTQMLEALRAADPHLSVVVLGFNDLETEHANQFTTVGQTTTNITEAVAALIERRWAAPSAPYLTRYLAPELAVRATARKSL